MRRGFSLVELLIGVVTASVLALVTAQLFRIGMRTYQATLRQDQALSVIRGALGAEGSRVGLTWTSRGARAVQSLSATSLNVYASTTAVVTSFTTSGGTLWKTDASGTSKLTDRVAAIAVNYYNLDGSGRVVESTSAVAAALVTVRLTMTQVSDQKSYESFSGALLRNRP